MAQKETAEQKLLKIIEASKKAKADSQAAAKGEPAANTVVKKGKSGFSFSVKQVNIFLLVCMVASLIFFGYEIRSGWLLLQQNVAFAVDAKGNKDALNLFVPQLKSIAYYLDKSSFRNIFLPYEKEALVVQGVVSGKEAFEKRMSKFRLVGIAWLDVPESATVMLEDKATRMTYFLKEGDKVEDVIIKTIYTDRVVFSHANEEITIKL